MRRKNWIFPAVGELWHKLGRIQTKSGFEISSTGLCCVAGVSLNGRFAFANLHLFYSLIALLLGSDFSDCLIS